MEGMLNEKEAAEYLGLSPGSLQQWRTTKRWPLRYYKIGGAVRYKRADLDAFIESGAVVVKGRKAK